MGKSLAAVLVGAAASLLCAAPALAAFNPFLPRDDYRVGLKPESLAVADFNRDDDEDLVVANGNSDTVSLLRGRGNGTFGTQGPFRAGDEPTAVVAADFNRDGRPDVAVTNEFGSSVSVMLRRDGGFTNAGHYKVGDNPRAVAAGDFDEDGRLDLAVVNRSNVKKTVSILLGDGEGRFERGENSELGTKAQSVSVEDFDGDGHADLAIGRWGVDRVAIKLGQGDGTFRSAVDYQLHGGSTASDGFSVAFHADDFSLSVAVADLNGDGASDLAVTDANVNDVTILLGNGDGTFGSRRHFAAGARPRWVAVDDFTEDGDPDLAIANINSDSITVWRGEGDGRFDRRRDYPAGNEPMFIGSGDFQREGTKDLAIVNRMSHSVSIRLNRR